MATRTPPYDQGGLIHSQPPRPHHMALITPMWPPGPHHLPMGTLFCGLEDLIHTSMGTSSIPDPGHVHMTTGTTARPPELHCMPMGTSYPIPLPTSGRGPLDPSDDTSTGDDSMRTSQLNVGTSTDVSLKITETDLSLLTASIRAPSGNEEPCLLKRLPNRHIGMWGTQGQGDVGDGDVRVVPGECGCRRTTMWARGWWVHREGDVGRGELG